MVPCAGANTKNLGVQECGFQHESGSVFPNTLNRLPRRTGTVREGQDFRREITIVANVAQRFDNWHDARVSRTHGEAVTVGEMHVADVSASGAESIGYRRLLDVHVEEIGEQPDILGSQTLEEFRRFSQPIEQVGFITIERLIEKHLAMAAGMGIELLESLPEPGQRLVP